MAIAYDEPPAHKAANDGVLMIGRVAVTGNPYN
jgi:hypothetical protein